MGILRLAHVDVRTPDLELSTAYYTEVLGLQLAERGDDTVYFKCWDEEDHHSIRLRYDPRTGLDLFSFRVEHEDDLAELEKAVEGYGCQVQRVGLVRWRMNTSMGPNAVRAAAALNAAGSVTRESFSRAAYLAGQLVSMPAAPQVTPI